MDARAKIDNYISSQVDWQKKNLEAFRRLLHSTQPNITEDWKWDVPVFIFNGKLLCAMSTFKNHTKFNFFEGAKLEDKHNLFNSGLDSKKHRSINLTENDKLDISDITDLILEATK